MIIDAHAHLSQTDYGNLDLLIRDLDGAQVDRCIVVPGGMLDVRVMGLYVLGEKRPDPAIPNHVVYDAIARFPQRLVGFFCLNPLEEEQAWAIFEEGIRAGCVGVKLNPLGHRFAFSGPVLDQIARRCGELSMPIYTHTLFDPGCRTKKLGELARRHPRTNFILGHMGFGSVDVHAIELARELPNFYLETSLASYLCLTEAHARVGPDKLIFGSEFPVSTPAIQLFQIRQLPAAGHERILAGNIQRLVPALTQ